MRQLLGDEEALVRSETPPQGLLQLRDLRSQLPFGQSGHLRSVRRTRDQGFEHLPPRLAHDVRGDRGKFYVGSFQRLLQPTYLGRAFPHQGRSVVGEFPQLPLGSFGHEASPQQTVPEQLGDPLAIFDVGLATRDGLDVPGVDQKRRESPLQQYSRATRATKLSLSRPWTITCACLAKRPNS